MKISLPAQNIAIQTPQDVIDPTWYDKLVAIIAQLNSGAIGQPSLAANATAGFGFIPTIAGTPTGVPIAQAGFAPIVFQPSANKLWIYSGGWKGVVVT